MCRDRTFLLFLPAIALVVTIFVAPATAHAQSSSVSDYDRFGVNIVLSPTHPRPGNLVKAKIKQYLVDDDFSLVTWKVNGELVLQGYGEIEHEFRAGPVGSLLDVQVELKAGDGRVVSGSKTLRISDVSFMWEARTYTPPFFLGQPKFTYGAEVVIVANPTVFSMAGEQYDISELTFEWMKGVQTITTGRGLNSFVASPSTPFEPLETTVVVYDPTGVERMTHHIRLGPSPSRLVLYEDDPLLGVLYNRAIPDSYNLAKEELKLVAEPLYSTARSRVDPTLSYAWTVNSAAYNFPGSIVLRPDGDVSGTTDVSLVILNANNFLERLQKRISVQYSPNGTTGTLWTDTQTDPL